jgi:hypothetical protein
MVSTEKKCTKCHYVKDISVFNKDKNKKDGLRTICRECVKINNLLFREKNPIKYRESQKKYRDNNKEKESLRQKVWKNNNKDIITQYSTEYEKIRKKKDPIYHLIRICRGRIRSYFKLKNITKKNRTFDIIGCSPEFLKEHIEKQFTEGMSWELTGEKIHIDHKIPLSSAKTDSEVHRLCHYTNLQPLWAEDNLKKSNKWE